jgi:hypothetical protein
LTEVFSSKGVGCAIIEDGMGVRWHKRRGVAPR